MLLFDAPGTGTFELYESDPRRLTVRPANDDWWQEPKPNSKVRLYCSTPSGMHDTNTGFQNNTLRTLEVLGKNNVVNDHQVLGLPSSMAGGWTQYAHPHWHPSGDRICLAGLASGLGTIAEFNATVEPFTIAYLNRQTGGSPLPSSVNDPSYSPDGTKIVYTEVNTGHHRINTVAAGSNFATPDILLTDLVSPALEWYDPYYSPDGSKIVVLARTGVDDGSHLIGQWGLYIIDADGSNGHWLINDGNVNGRARWVDNTKIIFHKWEYPLTTVYASIWSINLDGTNLKKVIEVGEYPCVK